MLLNGRCHHKRFVFYGWFITPITMVYDTYTIITIVNKPTYNALKNQKSFASSGLKVNQYRCKLETPTPLPDKVPVTIGQPKKCISEFLQVSPIASCSGSVSAAVSAQGRVSRIVHASLITQHGNETHLLRSFFPVVPRFSTLVPVCFGCIPSPISAEELAGYAQDPNCFPGEEYLKCDMYINMLTLEQFAFWCEWEHSLF